MSSKRIDVNTAETLLRMGISSLDSARDRITALDPIIDGAAVRKATKLATARKRVAEARVMLQEFAEANGIELRNTMKT